MTDSKEYILNPIRHKNLLFEKKYRNIFSNYF